MIKLKDLIKEEYNEHENDRDMVVGVAEIVSMIRENVIYNRREITKMCGL